MSGDLYDVTSQNGYIYADNNPVMLTDDIGTIPLETVTDIVAVGVSGYNLIKEPSLKNAVALIGDVVAAVTPYVPSPTSVKVGSKVVTKGGNSTVKLNLQYFAAPTKSNNRPQNLSPKGAGRKGAFKEAKRNSGIPVSQQPKKVTAAVDKRGKKIPGRDYDFGNGKIIRNHAAGHNFPDNPSQNRGPHFNDSKKNHYDY